LTANGARSPSASGEGAATVALVPPVLSEPTGIRVQRTDAQEIRRRAWLLDHIDVVDT
jgi:hypothetical protein